MSDFEKCIIRTAEIIDNCVNAFNYYDRKYDIISKTIYATAVGYDIVVKVSPYYSFYKMVRVII